MLECAINRAPTSFRPAAKLEPPLPLHPDDDARGKQGHRTEREEVAVFVTPLRVDLRHELEVHAPEAYQERQRDEHRAHHRQGADHFVGPLFPNRL